MRSSWLGPTDTNYETPDVPLLDWADQVLALYLSYLGKIQT